MDHQDAAEKQFLERYLLDELGPSERDDFEAHLSACSQCAEDLRAAAVILDHAPDLLRAAKVERPSGATLAGTGLPGGGWQARLKEWFRIPVFAPAALTLALAMVVGYQNLIQIPALRASRTVPSFALLPLTRGDDKVLTIPNESPTLIVTIDLTVPSPSGYLLEFSSESGSRWLNLRESPPPGMDSLSIQLNAADVPLGRQILVARAAASGEELMRFRFVTEKP